MALSNEQKYIRKAMLLGAISSILAILFSWYLSKFIQIKPHQNIPLRIEIFALGMFLAILPMVIMIGKIAGMRFFSIGIDGSSTKLIDISVKILNNTHEQTLLFMIASLALTISIPEDRLAMTPILAVFFILARMNFWYSYYNNAIKRAYGFAATFYMSILILVCSIFFYMKYQ